jgi:SulP family sulfate permease
MNSPCDLFLRAIGAPKPFDTEKLSGPLDVLRAAHDLDKGVFVGVLLSGIFFDHKVSHVLRLDRGSDAESRERRCTVVGQVFAATRFHQRRPLSRWIFVDRLIS